MKNRRGLTAVAMAGMMGAMTLAVFLPMPQPDGFRAATLMFTMILTVPCTKAGLTHPMDIITPIFLPVRW